MQVRMAIEALKTIAHSCEHGATLENLKLLGTYGEIERFFHNYAQEKHLNNKFKEELRRFRHGLEAYAELWDGNGLSEQWVTWMLGAASALESSHCFEKFLDDPQ